MNQSERSYGYHRLSNTKFSWKRSIFRNFKLNYYIIFDKLKPVICGIECPNGSQLSQKVFCDSRKNPTDPGNWETKSSGSRWTCEIPTEDSKTRCNENLLPSSTGGSWSCWKKLFPNNLKKICGFVCNSGTKTLWKSPLRTKCSWHQNEWETLRGDLDEIEKICP